MVTKQVTYCILSFLISILPHSHESPVHQITLEVYEDYDLTKEDQNTWEENILDNLHPVQVWPNILLPCDRPNVVTMTVTTLSSSTPATIQAGTSGPSTSACITNRLDLQLDVRLPPYTQSWWHRGCPSRLRAKV